MDASSSSQEAGPSALKTPVTDQSEWASSSTPSRQTFPRRLSLLQSDSAVSSPIRTPTSASVDSQSQSQQQQQQQQQQNDRMTSFTGPKPLSLSSQPMTSSVSGGSDTPRRGKRTSLSYIPSPSTSVKAGDDGPLSSASMGRTRTGSISRATSSASRRRPSQASQSAHSDAADDWLVSEEDASFSYPAAARAMGERDSAKVEAQFHDTGYREGITAGKLSTLQNGFDQGFNETAPTATARSSATAGRIRPSASSTGGSAGSSLPLLSHPGVEEAKVELRALAKVMDEVTLAKLAEPDYEALEHERQDLGEDDGNAVQRETVEEKRAREAILENLTQRLQQIRQMVGLRALQE